MHARTLDPTVRKRTGITSILTAGSVAMAFALILGACSSPAADSGHKKKHHHPRSHETTTTTTSGAPAGLCPLTGLPVPGGGPIPARPVLAVKIDNYVTARPQTGLNHADIVFEEPVEGGITRYVAVFQCQTAGVVGPVRSARNIDIGILGEFGHPLLTHVGGIQPVLANIDASPITNLDLGQNGSIEQHPTGRVAPYDTYSTTAALWALYPTNTTPPAPVFTFTAKTPTGTDVFPAQYVAVPFSGNSNVIWNYDTKTHMFLRNYGYHADDLATGAQNAAANVIVQYVQITYGPWVENGTSGMEVQANLYQDASGQALVFRNGVEVTGNWSRDALTAPTTFTGTNGQPIALKPGPTWVELVPNTVHVAVAAPPPPPPTTTKPKGHPSSNSSSHHTHHPKGNPHSSHST